MQNSKKMQISKMDASRRQLEIAIRLYFNNEDPVSIHTLTAAAYNVIKDIKKKKTNKNMFIKNMDYIKEEYKDFLIKNINEAENFFKHADTDSDKILDFKPALTELLIWDACLHYTELSGENPPLFKLFIPWFLKCNPKIIDENNIIGKGFIAEIDSFKDYSKEQYYAEMLQPFHALL